MSITSDVAYALAVPFACGVAAQRLVAILDAVEQWSGAPAPKRAGFSAAISFGFGLLVVWLAHLRVLDVITTATGIKWSPDAICHDCADVIVSALIISAGTEGFNSIIKFLGYAKEQTKATAAAKTQAAKTQAAKSDNADAVKALHS